MQAGRDSGKHLRNWKAPSVLPGFGLSFGITVSYLSLLILIPLAGIFIKSASLSWHEIGAILTSERILLAVWLSLWTALTAAIINVIFGFLVAWVLIRYDFPGKRFVDASIDLPFALPTAVAGLSLTALYAKNGWIGAIFAKYNIAIAYTPTGIIIALVFIGLPFVVRSIQPALSELDREVEEAAASLGAGRLTTFCKIILPAVLPSVLTGFALAFGRAIGEYGSVIFIAANLPFKTEIAPLMIVIQLEGTSPNRYANAATIGVMLLLLSFCVLLMINLLQSWNRRRYGQA